MDKFTRGAGGGGSGPALGYPEQSLNESTYFRNAILDPLLHFQLWGFTTLTYPLAQAKHGLKGSRIREVGILEVS